MRFKHNTLKSGEEQEQDESCARKEATQCILLTYPDTRVRAQWNTRAQEAMDFLENIENQSEQEVLELEHIVQRTTNRRRTMVRKAITEHNKLPISDEILQTYEVVKEVERKVDEYIEVINTQAEDK
jgi:DNA polymerase III delta prime subunit